MDESKPADASGSALTWGIALWFVLYGAIGLMVGALGVMGGPAPQVSHDACTGPLAAIVTVTAGAMKHLINLALGVSALPHLAAGAWYLGRPGRAAAVGLSVLCLLDCGFWVLALLVLGFGGDGVVAVVALCGALFHFGAFLACLQTER